MVVPIRLANRIRRVCFAVAVGAGSGKAVSSNGRFTYVGQDRQCTWLGERAASRLRRDGPAPTGLAAANSTPVRAEFSARADRRGNLSESTASAATRAPG